MAHRKYYQCAYLISNHWHKYRTCDNDCSRRDYGHGDMNGIRIDRCALLVARRRNRCAYANDGVRRRCRCRLAGFPAIWFLV